MKKRYPLACSLLILSALSACSETETENEDTSLTGVDNEVSEDDSDHEELEDIETEELNQAEEIATEFIRNVAEIERYRIEFEIAGEENDPLDTIEYADLFADPIHSRFESNEEETTGTMYQASDGQHVINYQDYYNVYNEEELPIEEDAAADLLNWASTLESNIAEEDTSLTYEGEEEVNDVLTYKVIVSFDEGESEYWFDQETNMIVKRKTSAQFEQTITVWDFEEVDEFDEGFFQLEDVIPDDAEEGDIVEEMAEEQDNN
ncbi:hypothetical protein DH09_11580 [Bacillaceae bacterium JMAK1]|nr:hypothetical protein DH09_11580 [Bacillaceae bacterium JMAK1]